MANVDYGLNTASNHSQAFARKPPALKTELLNYTHHYDDQSQEFFSFVMKLGDGLVLNSNWMTVVDGVVHDCSYGIDDDSYDGEIIPTSPMVNIPSSCRAGQDAYDKSLLPHFLAAISEHVGFAVSVPMLCEGEEWEQIHALKKSVGYDFVGDDFECSPAK